MQHVTPASTAACTLLVTAMPHHSPAAPQPQYSASSADSGSPRHQKLPRLTRLPSACLPAPRMQPDSTLLMASPTSETSRGGRQASTMRTTCSSSASGSRWHASTQHAVDCCRSIHSM
eukprot:GHRQ01030413.1.p2 GENE.GHRQ01030413.1~~GHRQ01030413.1.p2  ORF type:complete len:118 (-),score=38.06 GHRQ01030413.1:279-632(-)